MFAEIIEAVAKGFAIVIAVMWLLGWSIMIGLGLLWYLVRRLKA